MVEAIVKQVITDVSKEETGEEGVRVVLWEHKLNDGPPWEPEGEHQYGRHDKSISKRKEDNIAHKSWITDPLVGNGENHASKSEPQRRIGDQATWSQCETGNGERCTRLASNQTTP